jgi:CRP-like cAMP-binding protein
VQNSIVVEQNRLLKGLDAADLARLQPNLKKVRMTLSHVLHQAGAPIRHIYFPESGMVSIIAVMKSGEQIETAIIGNEGVIGGWVAIDAYSANTQSMVQMEGSAWEIPTSKFLEMYQTNDPFRAAINRYQGVILFQAQQSAVCHAVHSVEARLCRRLLLSQDIMGSDQITLTQEFLSHMLGVQRTSVSICAHALQKSGLIQYSRGKIQLLDRKGLEECACECYSVIREHIDNVIISPSSPCVKLKIGHVLAG